MSTRPCNLPDACSTPTSVPALPHHESLRIPIYARDHNAISAQVFGASSPLATSVVGLLKSTGFQIVGIWDTNASCAEQFGYKHRVAVHSSNIDTLILREQPMINVILAPPQFAAEIVIKSLSLDKHVLVIPPSMLDLHEATRSLNTARYAPDLISSPLFPLRALPGISRLREILSANELGRVLAVEARVVGGRVLPYEHISKLRHHDTNKWKWDKRMLGAPLDTVMSHVIDLITCIAAAANSKYDGSGCRIGRVTCSATDLDHVLKEQQSTDDNFSFYCRPNAECIIMSHMLSQNRSTQFLMSLNFLYPDRPFELDVHVACTHGRVRIRKCTLRGSSSFADMDGSASLMNDARRNENEAFVGSLADNGRETLLRDAASYKVLVEKYDRVSGSCVDEQTFDLVPSSSLSDHDEDADDLQQEETTTPVPQQQRSLSAEAFSAASLPKKTVGASSETSYHDSFYCSALIAGGLRATFEQVKSQLTAEGGGDADLKLPTEHFRFRLPTLYDGVYTMQVISALRASCEQHDRWQTVTLPSMPTSSDGAAAPGAKSTLEENCLSYIDDPVRR